MSERIKDRQTKGQREIKEKKQFWYERTCERKDKIEKIWKDRKKEGKNKKREIIHNNNNVIIIIILIL